MGFAFSFVGGALCLDFVNTVSWHLAERPVEHLERYGDLVAWALQAEVLDDEQAGRLLDRAVEDGGTLGRALALREALFRTFRGEPTEGDLERINEVLAEAMGRAVLYPAGAGLTWGWPHAEPEPPARMLWPVVRSAAELLSSAQADKVSICAGGDCGWLFLDASRRRRWCSMRGCGNRAKAARYYERHK
ncbi:ABATE domain-containing protein [Actinomadura sp. B10D3]|uniref:CGNR zinc finger domain-containing protein n=1 Tax=Actinomadura sp. B10D3 TaxID=3153557 RepID=UPI00325EDE7D